MNQKKFRIGSRESALAVVQSELIIEEIKKILPEAETELVTMKTTGDRILDRPLDLVGGKGLFVKELDRALLNGQCDLTVHCVKDMPMETPGELPVVAYSEREDPRDVLVLRKGLAELPKRSVIGTSSRRRVMQAEKLFPEAEFKGIRGNILTRLQKLDAGEYDALILAAAGLKRLGLEERISRYFKVEEMIPAAGQGILAVQSRKELAGHPLFSRMDHLTARVYAEAERAFVKELDGGCSAPTAASAQMEDGKLKLIGLCWEPQTGTWITGSMTGRAEEAKALGVSLAEELRRRLQEETQMKRTLKEKRKNL